MSFVCRYARRAAAALTLLMIIGCNGAGAGDAATGPAALETVEERGSYAIGMNMARGLREQQVAIEAEQLLQGMRDALAGTPSMSDEEYEAALMAFEERMSAGDPEVTDRNLRDGEAFLEENRQRPGVMVTDSGMQYEIVREGDGPSPELGDRVRVHYRGLQIDGTVFNDSYPSGEPVVFELGPVIPGWNEGLPMMKTGGKWKFYLPPDLGYGTNDPPGSTFGPNATLIFEVELLGIVGKE